MNEGKEITMLYDEIINIVTLAGEMILQAHEEELTIYDKAGISNFVTKHDKDVQSYLIRNLRIILPEANFLAEEDGIQQELGEGNCLPTGGKLPPKYVDHYPL